MSKKTEESEEQLEEIAENIEPEKKGKAAKAKASKQAGQLPILLMIGGALGGVVMIIVSVIIGTVIAQKLFPPQIGGAPAETEEHAEAAEGEHGHAVENLGPVPDAEDMEEEGAPSNLLADAGTLTFLSGKLNSNTKGSKTICALEFVAEYKPYYVEQLTAKGFLTEAGVDSHGNPAPPGVDTTNDLYTKLKQSVKSEMMLFFNSRTSDDIQNMQSIGVLADTLKNVLKKPFKETGLQIGKVSISGFNVVGS